MQGMMPIQPATINTQQNSRRSGGSNQSSETGFYPAQNNNNFQMNTKNRPIPYDVQSNSSYGSINKKEHFSSDEEQAR